MGVKVGQNAPDFELYGKEAGADAHDVDRYSGRGVTVWGVTGHYPQLIAAWDRENDFGVPILADYDHEVSRAYVGLYEDVLPLNVRLTTKRGVMGISRDGTDRRDDQRGTLRRGRGLGHPVRRRLTPARPCLAVPRHATLGSGRRCTSGLVRRADQHLGPSADGVGRGPADHGQEGDALSPIRPTKTPEQRGRPGYEGDARGWGAKRTLRSHRSVRHRRGQVPPSTSRA